MKLNIVVLSILISLLNVTSCSFASSKLPLNPKSISINWNKNGGMLYFSESISINSDTCEYHVNREGLKQDVKFILAENELRELYQIFIENQFDLIKTYEEEVYDRGGTGISLKVDGESYHVSNSGMSMVEEKFYKRYKIIESAIHKYANQELDKLKMSVALNLDESISNSNFNIVIYSNGQKIYSEKEEGAYKVLTNHYFKKNNKFEVYLMNQDGNHDYDKMVKNYSIIIEELSVNTKELTLSLVEGELIIK